MLPSDVCFDTDLVLSCSHALQPTVEVKFGSVTETLRSCFSGRDRVGRSVLCARGKRYYWA